MTLVNTVILAGDRGTDRSGHSNPDLDVGDMDYAAVSLWKVLRRAS